MGLDDHWTIKTSVHVTRKGVKTAQAWFIGDRDEGDREGDKDKAG